MSKLNKAIEKLFLKHRKKLLFHGWHHIVFVKKKALEFGKSIKANAFLVESSTLVHDLNYILRPNSEPKQARKYREEILTKAGYPKEEIKRIESIVMESHTRTRKKKISNEGKALSDADMLFKALPITPVVFANNYITQNKVDLRELAEKITSEQNRLMKENIYFYTNLARKKYLGWAKDNLRLWNNITTALKDRDISKTLLMAKKLKVL